MFTRFLKERGQYVPPSEHGKDIPGQPLIWKGYTSALVWSRPEKRWLPVCFEITERLELDLRGRYKRGQIWECSREEKTKKKPRPAARGQLLEERKDSETPPELDLVPFLRSFYHRQDLDLDTPNPFPPITMVEAVEAAAPGQGTSDKSKADPVEEKAALEKNRLKLHGLLNGRV